MAFRSLLPVWAKAGTEMIEGININMIIISLIKLVMWNDSNSLFFHVVYLSRCLILLSSFLRLNLDCLHSLVG